ncbi:MAG: hypothetical protein WAO35_11855 [Terriglobia bacterium]
MLALAPATLLGSQPAAPAPSSGQPASTGAADFHTQSLSHLRVVRGDHTFDVYLFAPDMNVDVLAASFCGGDQGARQYSGHFQLLSVADDTVVSKFDLDPDDTFVEKKPHDGARLFHDPKTGQNLVAIYQYGSCKSESVQFFSLDPSGHLFSVPFLDPDGRTWKQMLIGPDGAIPNFPSGGLMFCSFGEDIGYDFCGAYTFDGANFQEAAKWMTQEVAAPAKGLNDVGVAARTLFDFLSALAVKRYSAAAYDVDVNVEAPGAGPVTAGRGQKAAFLENYCTVKGGQCLLPVKMETKPNPGAPGTLLFQVSFQTFDFHPLTIDSRSSFEFRVAKKPDGFKVIDLPPRIP